MEELIELLRDGRSRSLEMLAEELGLSVAQVGGYIQFLERVGAIKRVEMNTCGGSCSGCSSGDSQCKGCTPEGGFQNMGTMWEVV